MIRNSSAALICVAVTFAAIPAIAQNNSAAVMDAIKICLADVHKNGASDFQKFDAFYNPATKAIEDNALFGSAPKYAFRKCMASHGFPLDDSGAPK